MLRALIQADGPGHFDLLYNAFVRVLFGIRLSPSPSLSFRAVRLQALPGTIIGAILGEAPALFRTLPGAFGSNLPGNFSAFPGNIRGSPGNVRHINRLFF